MELETKTRILAGTAFAQVSAHESAKRAGPLGKSLSEQTALIHRDASRALEIAVMGDGKSELLKDCTRMEETLADVIIHCLVLAGHQGLHLAPALLSKLEHNEAVSKLVKLDY